ncbi:MAG: rhomboid family intramembrane serine protease, partial [Gordonia sp. (in: high G+C Gram-positive bacteria)]
RPACPQCLTPAPVGAQCVDCVRADSDRPAAAVPGRPAIGPPGIATRRPIATYTLMAVNIAVFGYCLWAAGSLSDVAVCEPLLHGELVRGNVFLGQYWRLLTAGFLHYGVLHLAVNMISLYLLGRDLEKVLGTGRYLLVYLTALLGGSAAVMVFQADDTRSAGASGAIFGLMGAMLVVVLRLRMSATPVLTIIGVNLVMSFTLTGVSLPAHVGGLLFGAAAAAVQVYAPAIVPSGNARTITAVGYGGAAALLVIALGISILVALTYTGAVLVYVR